MRSVRPLRFGAVVLLLLGSMAASLPEETVAATGGARSDGPPRPTRVVSLGDSVPTGAQCDCSPFPVLVAADLAAPGQRVGLEQLAEDGATSDDVAATVEDHLSDFSATDVVLLEAGANDVADLADGSDPLPDEQQVDAAAPRPSPPSRRPSTASSPPGHGSSSWTTGPSGSTGRSPTSSTHPPAGGARTS